MISAFTITEAVVSMAVTSIIISIVFVIFSITSERLFDFKMQNEKVADINRFTYSLNKSIFENETMQYKDNELIFKSFTGEKLTYALLDNYCVRTSRNVTDTFHFPVKYLVVDTLKGKTSNIYYQRLRLNIEADKQLYEFLFYKKIFANQFLNYEY